MVVVCKYQRALFFMELDLSIFPDKQIIYGFWILPVEEKGSFR